MNPIIIWAGGKRRIADDIIKLFPEKYNYYYEPFLGGMAIALNLSGHKMYLSDANEKLITTYQAIKEEPELVNTQLRDFESGLIESSNRQEYYNQIRDLYNTGNFDKFIVAGMFLFINQTCYNGVYRVNKKGHFNVAYNKQLRRMASREEILELSEWLQDKDLKAQDYREIKPKARDLVYIDSPYIPVSKTSNFTSYTNKEFNHQELKEFIDKLTREGVYVVASNNISAEELYKDYKIDYVSINRVIGCKKETRGKVKEIIIRNF